jgi:hypothetical protein
MISYREGWMPKVVFYNRHEDLIDFELVHAFSKFINTMDRLNIIKVSDVIISFNPDIEQKYKYKVEYIYE